MSETLGPKKSLLKFKSSFPVSKNNHKTVESKPLSLSVKID